MTTAFGWNLHGDYARELTFFVRYVGLTPLEVITSDTRTGAEIMGRADEFGTLQVGKLADLLVVDGDVIGDISISRGPRAVHRRDAGGEIQAGQLARPLPTRVKCGK